MYQPDTILKLKEPRSKEGEPFPYDRVRVVGQSPVSTPTPNAWEGAMGQSVLIEPVSDFGSVVDEPFGKLQTLYEVESLPPEPDLSQQVKVIPAGAAGPSPEDRFASESSNPLKARKRRTKTTKPSPLDVPPADEVA